MSDEYPDPDTYALRSVDIPNIAAPNINYRPPAPKTYRPRIGLIGAGGIAASHLDAYRSAGWDVVAICNRTLAKAEARAQEFSLMQYSTGKFCVFYHRYLLSGRA